jgi:hypothetical protein
MMLLEHAAPGFKSLSRSDELLPLPSRAAGLASRADAIADRAHEAARQDAVRSARNDAWSEEAREAAAKARESGGKYNAASVNQAINSAYRGQKGPTGKQRSVTHALLRGRD